LLSTSDEKHHTPWKKYGSKFTKEESFYL